MGTDNLFWKRKNRSLKRKSNLRGIPPKTFLIVCEGEKTEPNYFKSFKLSSATVKVEGCGMNTQSLVRKTMAFRENALKNGEQYDEVWCVLDRDDFPQQNFNEALKLAQKEQIKVAYSNEAFEIWYLLHFHYFKAALHRNIYKKKLSSLLGYPYKKNCSTMYNELLDKQQTAIKNAETLLNTYNPNDPGNDNPSTTVHHLVKELNKFLQKLS